MVEIYNKLATIYIYNMSRRKVIRTQSVKPFKYNFEMIVLNVVINAVYRVI